MTDITINIKTGSNNTEPRITTTANNAKTVVPDTESTKDESPKKDDAKEMDMTNEEHAKMDAEK